jgi:hypothetical protein
VTLVTGNVDDYLKHVRTPDEAARLDDDLAETIAQLKGQPAVPKARIEALQAARRELHRKYPEILERAFGETAAGKPRPEGLGPRGEAHKRSGQAVTRTGRNRPKKSAPATTRRPARASGGGRRRSRGWLGRSVDQTGVPGAARGATANALEFIGVLIGLSLAYLLLSNAQRAQKGRSAVELLSKGIATGVQRVVSAQPAFSTAPGGSGGAGGVGATAQRLSDQAAGAGGHAALDAGLAAAVPLHLTPQAAKRPLKAHP